MSVAYIGTGSRIKILSAAAAVTGGTPHVENGFHGIVQTTAAINTPYAMNITGEFDVAFITSSVQGDLITINDTTKALARVAQGSAAAAGSGARAFARVSAVPGTAGTGTHGNFPKAGRMWVILLPPGNPTA